MTVSNEILLGLLAPVVIMIAIMAVVIADTGHNSDRIDYLEKHFVSREVIDLKIRNSITNFTILQKGHDEDTR